MGLVVICRHAVVLAVAVVKFRELVYELMMTPNRVPAESFARLCACVNDTQLVVYAAQAQRLL